MSSAENTLFDAAGAAQQTSVAASLMPIPRWRSWCGHRCCRGGA